MTTRVWKVGDKDCPICATMAGFDRVEIHGKGAYYRQIDLSDIGYKPELKEYLKENVVAKDGTIDIPVYVVEWRDIIIGAIQGKRSRFEFKKELGEILKQRTK